MIDIDDFMQEYYDTAPPHMFSVEEFTEWKENNGIQEWDYPLEEYKHIAENNIECVSVRFLDNMGGEEYRWCEIPAEKKYPDYIVRDVRQNMGLEPDDTSRDSEILTMTPAEIFDRGLEWQGIIGYSHRILSAIEEIFDINLDE